MLSLRRTPQGVEYFELDRQIPASTTSTTDAEDESDAKVMLSVAGSSRCPVTTIKNYISHLNPTSDVFFQRPRDSRSFKFKTEDAIWYCPAPLGRSTLEKFLREMSKRAGIEPHLTKHCLRTTSVAVLADIYCRKRNTVKTETADTSDKSTKSHHHPPSQEQQQQASALLANFLSSETGAPAGTRIIAPIGAKVIATVIEIEQQQNSGRGEIVLQVRKTPIVVEQPQQQLAVSSSSNSVNVVRGGQLNGFPLPCNLYNVQIQNTPENRPVPLAPRPENKSHQK